VSYGELPEALQATVARFVEKIGRRGTVTYSELNDALDEQDVTSAELEAILNFLQEHGIGVIE
jgi:hypothetical protein